MKEVGVDGYTATISGNNITNTRTGSIDLIVNKAWVAQGDHPADVTVQLYANGVAFGEPVVFTDSYTFKGLSKYDASGEEIKSGAFPKEVSLHSYEARTPSDHFPVVVRLEFRK